MLHEYAMVDTVVVGDTRLVKMVNPHGEGLSDTYLTPI